MLEPYYMQMARLMLDVEEVPYDLVNKLEAVEKMVQTVKPCGYLSSTQTVAAVILLWRFENEYNDNTGN